MREYVTEAIVLDKEPSGEGDTKVFLYTQSLGKVVAKAKSARKITSKLAAHLEPLSFIKLRLIEKNGFQVADALKENRLSSSRLKILRLINSLVLEGQPDYHLWSLLKTGVNSPSAFLKILGFDPMLATCATCSRGRPEYFSFLDQGYFCKNCLPRTLDSKIYIGLN